MRKGQRGHRRTSLRTLREQGGAQTSTPLSNHNCGSFYTSLSCWGQSHVMLGDGKQPAPQVDEPRAGYCQCGRGLPGGGNSDSPESPAYLRGQPWAGRGLEWAVSGGRGLVQHDAGLPEPRRCTLCLAPRFLYTCFKSTSRVRSPQPGVKTAIPGSP